jgi:hypothetical protein
MLVPADIKIDRVFHYIAVRFGSFRAGDPEHNVLKVITNNLEIDFLRNATRTTNLYND